MTKTGRYFIDQNPKMFRLILEHLRTNELISVSSLTEGEVNKLKKCIDYFQLDPDIIDRTGFGVSVIVTNKTLQCKLEEFYENPQQKWQLLFRASVDGFSCAKFHEKCNGKGPTMTIVKASNGNIFGGYTPISWHSNGGYSWDNRTFLFSLVNQSGILPTKFLNNGPNHGNTYSIHGNAGYGPTFGGGHDLHICNNPNSTTSSYCGIGHSFSNPTGISHILSGSYNFTVSDYEVFGLAP
jgi:hypothetical protein